MSRALSIIVWLATALWMGGMIFLFLAVQTLFRAFPRPDSEVAPQAAPALFDVFQTYQLALAVVAIVAAFAWYLVTRAKRIMLVFILLALAAAGAAVSTTLITPRMETLRVTGQSSSTQFRVLHARSMQCYVAQAGLLVAAAIILPFAAASYAPRRTAPESSAAAASPP